MPVPMSVIFVPSPATLVGMDNAWWGVVAVVVIGAAVVAYGWLSDRRVTRERERALAAAPGDGPTPAYVTEDSPRPEVAGLSDDARAALRAELADAVSFEAGWPGSEFVTDPASGWAVLPAPAVLVCPDELDDLRDLVAVIRRLRPMGETSGSPRTSGVGGGAAGQNNPQPNRPPLVVVAPGFGPSMLRTLAANAAHLALANLPVALDEAARETVCATTGATPVPRDDLRAGYVPADALGTCRTWVSDQQTSWVIPEKLST